MKTLQEHLAAIASKGGQVKGQSKRRGNSEHYKRLAAKAAKARKKKAKSGIHGARG
jgi:hypothetical protein